MVAVSAASSAAGTGTARKRKVAQVCLAYYTVILTQAYTINYFVIPQLLNYQK